SDVSANARCPKKTEHTQLQKPARQQGRICEFGIRIAEPSTTPSAEAAATPPYQGGELSEFGMLDGRLKPGPKTLGRFSRFNRFRRFICFIRFNRFRSIWPL
ncbi:MAG TPA: hypothetical protein PKE66_10660, partial [Pyrinomonadaceae bacterium]|nr:hypothetical protein [Pyrinomonadaceae bacterium]